MADMGEERGHKEYREYYRETDSGDALSCGFKETSLFDRHFRAAYGCTPMQYRKEEQG